MTFPATFNVSSLDGTNGFRIDGAAAGDFAGYSVASAGDINGDGFDDIVIGATNAMDGTYGFFQVGRAYVVFGGDGGFVPALDLAALDGTNGFSATSLYSVAAGISVGSAGDINGDGRNDLIIGTGGTGFGGAGTGGFIVFGQQNYPAYLDLLTLDGTNGFAASPGGRSVASAGDINGDGFDDFIVGGPSSAVGQAGASYVVFGHGGGFDPGLDLAALDGTDGFRLDGAPTEDPESRPAHSGWSVSSAGDVNGDGFDDIIVGEPDFTRGSTFPDINHSVGQSYVVFGHAGPFDPTLALSSLNGTNGFTLEGISAADQLGISVASAGDLNGDGFADVIVGAPGVDHGGNADAGSAYVLFGHNGGFASNLDLSTLNGTNGFRLDGAGTLDAAGASVASAGDVNGDGFDDLVVSAPRAGRAYVVYGQAAGFASTLDLGTLNGTNGFIVDGLAPDSGAIHGNQTVRSAGDLNDDGFADLIVGDYNADPGGRTDAGTAYVILGQQPDQAAYRLGTAVSQTLAGGAFNDLLAGLAGDDRLYGHGGDDTLLGGDGNDWVRGGAGDDVVDGGAGVDTASYQDAAGGVAVNLAVATLQNTGGAGWDRLYGFENLEGSRYDDQLTGDSGVNTLTGGAGNDRLNGGASADKLYGGIGNDTYYIDNIGDQVFESVGQGTDTVFTSVSWAMAANQAIDTLRAYGAGAISGVTLTGNEFANRLFGGSGVDHMAGGTGNDTYYVGNLGDEVTEAAGEGIDTVYASASWAMAGGQEIESLRSNSSADLTLSGNEFNNTVAGGAGNDTLAGESGSDRLMGGAGNDSLSGGLGHDILTGGNGADTFVYGSLSDSAVGSLRDLVADFTQGEDHMDLTGMEAELGIAFTFIGSSPFSHQAGQLRSFFAGTQTILAGDTNGDGAADFQIALKGNLALNGGDLIL